VAAPLQREKRQPFAGFAVRLTGRYDMNGAVHEERLQLSPSGELVTLPFPVISTVAG
jgi:hypothetical protein